MSIWILLTDPEAAKLAKGRRLRLYVTLSCQQKILECHENQIFFFFLSILPLTSILQIRSTA